MSKQPEEQDGKNLGFLKTTLTGAVLVVVPVGIIGFALWQIVTVFNKLLLPVVTWFPFDSPAISYLVLAVALTLVVSD